MPSSDPTSACSEVRLDAFRVHSLCRAPPLDSLTITKPIIFSNLRRTINNATTHLTYNTNYHTSRRRRLCASRFSIGIQSPRLPSFAPSEFRNSPSNQDGAGQ
ncbi:hypothetical protein VTJ04DRAFT_629 [Mycothermus thermophilus]|uniref:uncharacterized protein n=1 Tax=Humicola insolens TaxID=85995 RepID=UPI003742415B